MATMDVWNGRGSWRKRWIVGSSNNWSAEPDDGEAGWSWTAWNAGSEWMAARAIGGSEAEEAADAVAPSADRSCELSTHEWMIARAIGGSEAEEAADAIVPSADRSCELSATIWFMHISMFSGQKKQQMQSRRAPTVPAS